MSIHDFKKEERTVDGGYLAMMLGMPENFREESVFMIPSSFAYSYSKAETGGFSEPSRDRIIIMNNKNTGLPRLVMFRDSFGGSVRSVFFTEFQQGLVFLDGKAYRGGN